MTDQRALARASGIASRIAPQVAELMRLEGLPVDARHQVVAVQEDLDLLRHCLRMATLQQVVDVPTKPKRRKRA